MTITSAEFNELAAESFDELCKSFDLKMRERDTFTVRFDGQEVFITLSYDAFRSCEIIANIGLQAGIVREVERPFQLSELLRAVGQYGLPEAQMQEIVTSHKDVKESLQHLARLFTKYGQESLRGDRALFSRLDTQRDLDCTRYQYDRDLDDASRAAFVAWSRAQYATVITLLSPFKARLTIEERKMLESAKAQVTKE